MSFSLKIVIKKSDLHKPDEPAHFFKNTHPIFGDVSLKSRISCEPSGKDFASLDSIFKNVSVKSCQLLQESMQNASLIIPNLLAIRSALHKLHLLLEWTGMHQESSLITVKRTIIIQICFSYFCILG